MTTTAAAEKKFTMSKSLGALIIALLAGAFFAGTRAAGAESHAEARPGPQVAAAALAAAPVEMITAEQVRGLRDDMRELRRELTDATKAVAGLSERLARLEGACGTTCGGH